VYSYTVRRYSPSWSFSLVRAGVSDFGRTYTQFLLPVDRATSSLFKFQF
jgi:hypothetical protein